MKRLKTIVFILLLILPAIIMIFFIRQYAINVPMGDSMTVVPLLQKMHSGQLAISDFWSQNNEHRPVFPLIIMLSLAKLTNWNMWYELYANWVIVAIALLFVYLLLRRTIGLSYPTLIPYLTMIFSFLLFSPTQWGNWLFGWQMVMFMSITTTVGAIWALVQWPGRLQGVLIAICFSFISNFSFNNGFLTWILVGFLLLTHSPRNWNHIVITIASFTASIFLYYYNYTSPQHHPLIVSLLPKYWSDIIIFIIAFIGAPLGMGKMYPSILIGVILIIIFCYETIKLWRFDKELFRSFLPWVALGCYSLISACAISIARIEGFGIKQALASRYITISHWLTMAVFIIIAIRIGKYLNNISPRLKNIYLASIVFVIVLGTIFIIPYVRNVLNMLEDRRTNIIQCWVNMDALPDESLKMLHPNPQGMRENAKIIKELGYAPRIEVSEK